MFTACCSMSSAACISVSILAAKAPEDCCWVGPHRATQEVWRSIPNVWELVLKFKGVKGKHEDVVKNTDVAIEKLEMDQDALGVRRSNFELYYSKLGRNAEADWKRMTEIEKSQKNIL